MTQGIVYVMCVCVWTKAEAWRTGFADSGGTFEEGLHFYYNTVVTLLF